MTKLALALIFIVLAAAGASELVVSSQAAQPRMWVTNGHHSLTACASTDCGAFTATFNWTAITWGHTTAGYNVLLNGSQYDTSPSSPYTFLGMDCGTTFTLGVQAYDSTGDTSAISSMSYSTPSCPGSAPINTILPAITGTATQAMTLTASDGTWTGSPTGYAFQWEDCNSSGASCSNISGATSGTYVLTASDIGDTIRVAVTATNASGSTSATSSQTGVVAEESNCFSSPGTCGLPDPNFSWNSAAAWASGGGGVGPNNGTTPTACSSLTSVTGPISTSSNGQTISNENITGEVTIQNNNVTLSNDCVTRNGNGSDGTFAVQINSGVTGATINDSIIKGGAASGSSEIEADVHISTSSAVTLSHDSMTNSTDTIEYLCIAGGNLTVNDSYMSIQGLLTGTEHVENIYGDTISSLSASHDVFLNNQGQTAGSIFNDTHCGSGGACASHFTLTQSLIAGGGFLYYLCGNSSSVGTSGATVTNNRIARCNSQASTFHSGSGGTTCGTLADNGPGDSGGYYPLGGYFNYSAATYFGSSGWTCSGNVWDDQNFGNTSHANASTGGC